MTSQELSFNAQKLAAMIQAAKNATDKIVIMVDEGGFKMWSTATLDRSGRYNEDKPPARSKVKVNRMSHAVALELIMNGRWREWVTPYGQTCLVLAEEYKRLTNKAKSNVVGSINRRAP